MTTMFKFTVSALLVLIFYPGSRAFAQTNQVTGKVLSPNKQPVEGVTVSVKGTNTATSTNAQGEYKITVSRSADVIVFSSAGFLGYEIPVNNRTVVDVELAPDVRNLDDLVVVGYSTVRRRDLTGSVSSVSSKQLKDIPLSSAAEALQGRLAGVTATASEGAPGADIIIRVRGGGSITQDNAPLYIVDGIQVENALSVIAPQDIASIDVLKDASTTAIYGARAANGVVVITTKAGRPGKTQINYNGSFGWRELPETMDVLSPYDFVVWQWERKLITSDTAKFQYGTNWDTLSVYKDINPINWQDEVFGRKANYQNHNVSVNGGDRNTTFNLSL
ncbi:MAG TPA: TonB-dependent receptor plug domain-containing protein, partial [Chitinophagaceae bacterium]|nr:TonB-dependent receptor plug domain-containing protein [Chitinophagaceae bacterium]